MNIMPNDEASNLLDEWKSYYSIEDTDNVEDLEEMDTKLGDVIEQLEDLEYNVEDMLREVKGYMKEASDLSDQISARKEEITAEPAFSVGEYVVRAVGPLSYFTVLDVIDKKGTDKDEHQYMLRSRDTAPYWMTASESELSY